jgi:acyl-CoA reductase-like NAD-dependent aldehyde dehydrogenase
VEGRSSGATDQVLEPATGRPLDEVASSDAADVDDAVAAAAAAFETWSNTLRANVSRC